MIRIDENAPVPIYLQIVEELKKMILGKSYEANQRLPSIRKIATETKVNPNTVGKSFQELESQGYIYFKRGQGAFVAEIDMEEQIMKARRELEIKIVEIIKLASQMGIDNKELEDIFSSVLNNDVEVI